MNLDALAKGKQLVREFKDSLRACDKKFTLVTETVETRQRKEIRVVSSLSVNDLLEKHKLSGLMLDSELNDRFSKLQALLSATPK